jgi:hypothetical protein
MSTLAAVLTDPHELQERGETFVREVVAKEGAATVVATVVRLCRERAERCAEALRFLTFHRDVPELGEAIETNGELADVLESMSRGRNVRERGTAIWALGEMPVRERDAVLVRIADTLSAENDVISLSSLLAFIELPEVVDRLLASEDWLVRWSLLPWTNQDVVSPTAADVRRRLAFDDHPLVSAEAHQHLRMLEEWEAAHAEVQGVAFAVLSNHGPALSFRGVASAFLESWPKEKSTYELEELRSFAERAAAQ